MLTECVGFKAFYRKNDNNVYTIVIQKQPDRFYINTA